MINSIDGHVLLESFLNVADLNGRIVVDKSTYLPDLKYYKEKDVFRQRIYSLMKVYDINPVLDKDFIDERPENYFICLINKELSDQRKDLFRKHINKLFELEDSDFSAMVSTREARFESFLYFFKYRKKLLEIEYSNCDIRKLVDSASQLICKALTDILFCKKIEPVCSFLDKAMLLLMGDYVDKKYKDVDLIRHYGYPGLLSSSRRNEINKTLGEFPF